MPQHVAGRVAREHLVHFHASQDFLRVVMKDEPQQLFESRAIGNMSTEHSSRPRAPRVYFGRGIRGQPGAVAQYRENIHRGEGIGGDHCVRLLVQGH